MVDFSSIEPLEQKARSAESSASSAASNVPTLVQKLTDAVNARYAESPLIKQREGAAQTLMSTPDQVRTEIGDKIAGGTILNPNQQQQIISSRQSANLVPLISLNDLLTAQFGTGRDIINSGTQAFKADADRLLGEAQLARATSDSAFDRLLKQAQFDLQERQANEKTAGNPVLDSLLGLIMSGQGQPDTVPSNGGSAGPQFSAPPGTVVEDDETGMMYQSTAQGWVPVQQQAPQQPEQNIFQRLFGGIGNIFQR